MLQALSDAEQQLRGVEADYKSLEARLQTDRLNQRAVAATVEADYQNAKLDQEVNEELAKDGLVSNLTLKQSTVRAESLATRFKIEQQRVQVAEQNIKAQLQAQQARIDQLRSIYGLRRSQVDQLRVRAGMDGVLEQITGRSRPAGDAGHAISRASRTRRVSRRNCASRKRRRAI